MKVKVGIVGSGWVARMRHIPAFRRDQRASVVSIYNSKAELAKEASLSLNIENYFNDYDKFLNSVDIVSICTPPFTHYELAAKALKAGKHVLLEKPFTMTVSEGKELEELAKVNSVVLMPAHNFIFGRAMKKALSVIRRGDCGEIISVYAAQWSSWQRQLPTWYEDLPGGLFFDEGPHLMYLMKAFLGEMHLTKASLEKTELKEGKDFERYNAEFKGNKGIGMMTASFGTPMSEWVVVVACEKKTLILDIFRDLCIEFNEEKSRNPIYLMKVVASADKQIWSGFVNWIIYRFTKGSHLFGADVLASHFIDVVLKEEKPLLTPQDGYSAIDLLRSIVEQTEKNGQ